MGTEPAPVVLTRSPAKIEVPRSFELYVDGAKWLLAIIAGLIAYGFDTLKDHPGNDRTLALFACSSVSLGLAAACALYYLLMSYTYLSRREGGSLVTDPAVTKAKRQSNLAFKGMLWLFAAGLLLFVLFGTSQLLVFRNGGDPVQVHAGSFATVVVQRGDRLWVLNRTIDGRSHWQPLPLIPDPSTARRRPSSNGHAPVAPA